MLSSKLYPQALHKTDKAIDASISLSLSLSLSLSGGDATRHCPRPSHPAQLHPAHPTQLEESTYAPRIVPAYLALRLVTGSNCSFILLLFIFLFVVCFLSLLYLGLVFVLLFCLFVLPFVFIPRLG